MIAAYLLYINKSRLTNAASLRGKTEIVKSSNLENSKFFWCKDYKKFHMKMAWKKETRKIIYNPGYGGLGDQFSGLLTYYMLAVVYQRAFFIQWTANVSLSDLFEGKVAEMFTNNLSRTESDEFLRFDSYKQSMDNLLEMLSSKENIFIVGNTAPSKRIRFWISAAERHFSSCSVLSNQIRKKFYSNQCTNNVMRISHLHRTDSVVQRSILQTVFPLSQKIIRLAEENRRVIFKKSSEIMKNSSKSFQKSENMTYVGVHARLGKGVNESSVSRFSGLYQNMEHVARCLAYFSISRATALKEKGYHIRNIYLATDTIEFRNVFSETVREISPEFVVTWSMRKPLHVAKYNNYVANLTSPTEVYKETLSEVLLLGGGLDIICIKSGFCNLSYQYSKKSTVFALRDWRKTCLVL